MDREKVIEGLQFIKEMITFDPSTGKDIDPGNLNELDKTTYYACVGAIALLKEQSQIVHCEDCICWKKAAEIGDGIYGCCRSSVINKEQMVNRSFFCGDGQSEKGGKTNWEKWKESME